MSVTKLWTGAKIPLLGLGTWKSQPGQVKEAVRVALEVGYRHIDCAAAYGNEPEVGEAVKDAFASGLLQRKDLFVTSKLWNTKHRPEDVRPALKKTLTDLQLEYLDLYLIHWPMGFKAGDVLLPKSEDGTILYDNTNYIDTWKAMEKLVDEGLIKHIGLSNFNSKQIDEKFTWEAMEKLVDEGLIKHIGLSNFNSKQIDEIITKCRIKPAALQCECHVYLPQKELVEHMKKKGIVFEAYSPLGSPDRPWAKPGEPLLMEDPKIMAIGKKYGKSAAQVLIRYQLERGLVVLPKSVTPHRIKDNFVVDFSLTAEDMTMLESFSRGWRCCNPMINVNGKDVPRDKDHPHYPFKIPY